MDISFADIVGILGVSIIVFVYFLLQVEKIDLKSLDYSLANTLGSMMILYSLMSSWNLASVVIELVWIIISLYGVFKYFSHESKAIKEEGIVFYDGECAFCSKMVQFLLKRDKKNKLHYAPLHGQTMKEKNVPTIDDETLIVYTESQVFYKSDAVIYTLNLLGGGWLVLGGFMGVFPKVFRDFVYEAIAKIRYLLAGKVDKDVCALLPKAYHDRFLS